MSLLFKQNLFINTTGKTVSSIQVDFANGAGFVTASWNNAISATYTDTGSKRLTFKLNFADATSLQCYSFVTITRISGGGPSYRYQPATVTTAFNPTGNNHSGGDVTVQYSVNNTSPANNRRFRKPLIIVEGFDMHDAAPLLMEKGYDYESFRREISQPAVSFNGNDFNHNLDDVASYDLIFLNYRDGTDNILRNALLLEEVITWVNNNKQVGAEQNVVLGISMGGLVSRYCLAKMTKENSNPQTRLLITHDSPHRGANIPLGIQYLLNDFANKNFLGKPLQDWLPPLKQAVALQLRPATIQQLLVRDNPSTRALEYNAFLADGGPYRQMVTFAPSDPRQPGYAFIATTQGSQCGVPVALPYTVLSHTSGNAGYAFLYGTFGTKFSGEVSINSLPNAQGAQRITYFDLTQKNRFLWIPFTSNLMHFEHYSPPGILGYDGAPGGTIPLSRGTGAGNVTPYNNGSANWYALLFSYAINFNGLYIQPEFSFVPTVSALDEDNITATSLYASHEGAAYIPPANPTTLRSYIAQERQAIGTVTINNARHTNFTARNAQWLFNEMQGLGHTLNCDDFCISSSVTITGEESICTNTTYNYVLNNLPANATVSWSASPAGVVQFSCATCAQTDITVTGNQPVTIIAIINNCNNLPVSKTLSFGNIQQYTEIRPIGYNPCYQLNQQYFFEIANPQQGIHYKWGLYTPSSGLVMDPAQTDNAYGYFTFTEYGDNRVTAIPYSICSGDGEYADYSAYVSPYGCNGYRVQSNTELFPNPARDQVTVKLKQLDSKLLTGQLKDIREVRIMDKFGSVKRALKYPPSTTVVSFNIGSLPLGVYYVEITDGKSNARMPLNVIK